MALIISSSVQLLEFFKFLSLIPLLQNGDHNNKAAVTIQRGHRWKACGMLPDTRLRTKLLIMVSLPGPPDSSDSLFLS